MEHIKEMAMYEFRLYLAGKTPESAEVSEKLAKLLEEAFDSNYHLEVIDVIENPEIAEEAKILATPTLEKIAPEPVAKIIGDLSDKEMVLPALGLTLQGKNK